MAPNPIIFNFKTSILLLFFTISTLFLSYFAVAGGRTNFVKLANQQFDASHQEASNPRKKREESESVKKERILRANHRDYGNYDPAPALVRPPFKLIPN